MKKYTNLILSTISLVVTTALLIVVLFAWYITNQQATAVGIEASIVARSNIVESVNVYSFSNVTTSNTTSTYTICAPKDMKYNPDFDKSPTAKLIEINFVSPSVNLTKLSSNSSSKYFPGFSDSSTSGYITDSENLSLSSVVKYTVVQNVSFSSGATTSSGTVSFTTPSSYLNYSYNDSTGVISNPVVDLIDSSLYSITSIYILLDFNQEAFDKLFSNNIGNVIIDEADQLEYNRDFKFQILGSVVE